MSENLYLTTGPLFAKTGFTRTPPAPHSYTTGGQMADKCAQLKLNTPDVTLDLPIQNATLGQDVINVSGLVSNGFFTFDPGFVSTASCESAITYIDGDQGVLLHRGYPIEQLAEKKQYTDICYLLMYGELPNAKQKSTFETKLRKSALIDSSMKNILSGFDRTAHPMALLSCLVSALAALFHDNIDITNIEMREEVAAHLIAKMPTLAALIYRHHHKLPIVEADTSLNYSENFLRMTFKDTELENRMTPVIAQAIDRIFLLHADHEQNASTSTVRLAGSTGANPFACICAGIATLWGPAHGGANEAVLKMLNEIGDVDHIPAFIKKAKDKSDPFRLMGFGHRVYKNFDPRAKVMKQTCDDVLSELGISDDPLLTIAKELEKIALEDDYFIDKKLYPNVDFYSGIILKALGIPTDMFTVMFATGRASGWIAHWHEMISNGYRISRPRQLYTGPKQRNI